MGDAAKVISPQGIQTSLFASGGLSFPSDVGNMSNTTPRIQFFINQQTNSQVEFAGGEVPAPATSQSAGKQNQGVAVPRAATKRLAGAITLYMPNKLSVSHKATYEEAEVGWAVAGLIGAIKMGGDIANSASILSSLKDAGAKILSSAADEGMAAGAKFVENLPGGAGAKAAFDIATGKVTNNRSEMAFTGIDRRTFSFTFRMLPASAQEAENIRSIVTLFRLHAMPEYEGETIGRTLIYPSTFDIEYSPGEKLHRISTCALESVEVQYGGDRPQFFEDGHAVETQLTLQFKELELITKEKIAEGY